MNFHFFQKDVHEKVQKNIQLLHHVLPNWERYLLMCTVPLYFMLISLSQQPLSEIFSSIRNIVREPDILISDYFVVGGVGAAFFNAGCLSILSLGILCIAKSDFDGSCIVAACLMFGFSLFGKNLLNIRSILIGYVLYAKVHRVPIKKYLYIGYVLVPISLHTKHAHMGYSLYNVGFSCGIIAIIVTSLMKSFGAKIESRLLWDSSHRPFGFFSLLSLFLTLILITLILGGDDTVSSYRELLKESGQGGTDFLKKYGDYPTILNMGINGLLMTVLLFAVGGDFNGPTIGSIFCVVGFSALGKHIRNILPVLLGVIIASYLKIWDLRDPSATLTLILSTTLAPITGDFGIFWGIVAGFLHSSVALNVGAVYNGTNLYNNGFAGGIVALFLVPIIQAVRSRMKPSALYKNEGK